MNKSVLYILLGLVLTIGAVEASVPSSQVYYKNQGYSQLVQATKELTNDLSKVKSPEDKEHALNIASIFMAQVLKGHPEYLANYAQKYSNLSFYEKAVFLKGIRSAGMNHDLLNDIADSKIMGIVNDPNLLTLSNLNHLQVKDAGDLDYLWGSYFATGNKGYIRQIVEVLNKDDEILFIAYEWINRLKLQEMLSSMGKNMPADFSDLEKHIEMQSVKRKNYRTQVSIYLAALWSLDANAAQDPTIGQVIQGIIKNDPSLDYWKKINKTLGR